MSRRAFVLSLLLVPAAHVLAQDEARVEAPIVIEPPEPRRVGDRSEVIVRVRIEGGAEPLMLTPTSEGPAVEVVRGRLLRGDADDRSADELRFRIPIIARSPGTAVLRVQVDGHSCDARARCRAVRGEAAAPVVVRP